MSNEKEAETDQSVPQKRTRTKNKRYFPENTVEEQSSAKKKKGPGKNGDQRVGKGKTSRKNMVLPIASDGIYS